MPIDWLQIAKSNGLSVDEFADEIMACATAVCATLLDKHGSKRMTRKTHDGISPVLMTVERLDEMPNAVLMRATRGDL